MAVRVEVSDQFLVVTLTGLDRLTALRGRLRVPTSSVRSIAAQARRKVPHTGLRLPGTALPGVIRAGSYGLGEHRDFWLTRRAQKVLVIELAPGQSYRRVVLQVPDPDEQADRLTALLRTG